MAGDGAVSTNAVSFVNMQTLKHMAGVFSETCLRLALEILEFFELQNRGIYYRL